MFDKDNFSLLLERAIGDRTATEFSNQSGVNRTYISKFLNKRVDNPPSPEILNRIADAAHNDVSYIQLMEACGYIKEYSNITKEIFDDEHFKKVLPIVLKGIHDMLLEKADEQDKIIIEKFDIETFFNNLINDNDKAEIFNTAIAKVTYQLPDDEGKDEIFLYPNIPIDESLIQYIKESYNKFMTLQNKNIKANDKEEPSFPDEFSTPEEAIKFLLEQNVIMGFGGFDIDKLTDEEKIEFANELLGQLKLLSYKYKK